MRPELGEKKKGLEEKGNKRDVLGNGVKKKETCLKEKRGPKKPLTRSKGEVKVQRPGVWKKQGLYGPMECAWGEK